ncbi:hypothetical protein M0Q50_01680 [bacterium]|nr:hypothetical protein [bacterium]
MYFYFSSVVLAQKQAELSNSNNEYNALASADVKAKENELALAGKYIGDFKILFQSNPNVYGFFIAFQSWTHPKVVYSGFTFDVPSRKVTMSGSTAGFQNIMQQIAILKVEPTIESYEISNINLGETGEVTFNLDMVIKPEVIK